MIKVFMEGLIGLKVKGINANLEQVMPSTKQNKTVIPCTQRHADYIGKKM